MSWDEMRWDEMGWDGLRVLSTQRGVWAKRQDGCYIPFSLAQLKVSTCPLFLPASFPQGRKQACLGQAPSSFPVPSSKASEANWKDWELLGLFQRGTGGTWKNWAFLLLPRDEQLEETPPPWGKDAAAPKGCGEKDLGLLEKRRCSFRPPPRPSKTPKLLWFGFFSSCLPISSPYTPGSGAAASISSSAVKQISRFI